MLNHDNITASSSDSKSSFHKGYGYKESFLVFDKFLVILQNVGPWTPLEKMQKCYLDVRL